MRKAKKISSIAAALLLVLSSAISVYAEGTKAEVQASEIGAGAKSSEKYTASSLEGLQEAVDAVRPVYEDVDATGEEVNEAARLLTGQLVEVRILGDVNNDKNVDTSDTALVLKLSAELLTIEDMDREAADVNRDGDVDTADAVLIQKFAAELIGSF